MAQKKITELGLIDEVTDGVNLVGDDSIQTYRFTAVQLKEYINAQIQDRLDLIEADNWVTPARIDDSYKNKVLVLRNFAQVTTNGTITFFTRNDLVIGKEYEVFIKMRYLTGSTNTPAMNVSHDGVTVGGVNVDPNPTANIVDSAADRFAFTATTNTVTINAVNTAAAHKIIGDTTVIYTELNSSKLVSSFA